MGDAGLTKEAPPLAGLRVLDTSSYATGPFMTGLLAQLGATVLKIERPPRGDPERFTTPAYFATFNRGKASVLLDTNEASDREPIDRLVAGTDIFVEGFRPGAAERAGLGFDRLRAIRPGLIYVSLPGFSSTGPYAKARGYDVQYQALAGGLAFDEEADNAPAYRSPFPIFDYVAAMYAVMAVLAVLPRRPAEGLRLEIPIVAAGLSLTFPAVLDAMSHGVRRPMVRHTFQAADGRYLAITVPQDQDFHALCDAIGKPELKDVPEFATYRGRVDNGRRLGSLIAEAIATKTASDWLDVLIPFGVPVAVVNTVATILTDPEIKGLDLIHEVGDGDLHMHLPVAGLPKVDLSQAPTLGAHTEQVRELGWDGLLS